MPRVEVNGFPSPWNATSSRHDRLRLGIPNTGRLFLGAGHLIESIFGIDVTSTRALLHRIHDDWEVVCARSNDLPFLLGNGVVDLAITGRDYVHESAEDLVELVELGITKGVVCALVPRDSAPDLLETPDLPLVSQYPRIASRWAEGKGIRPKIMRVTGAAEVYPSLGMASATVDNVSSGRTSQDNNLVVAEEILKTSGCVFASKTRTLTPEEKHLIVSLGRL